ncbi:hypothetical protein [Salinibacter altiplanensis]|uniref:hypothetical protein n=1 Tax=Salinibacter altiplanensis TaxID=1803181 RepID=UPI001319B898|nr:hypothetical protein [Salinibacter altiplanensis]
MFLSRPEWDSANAWAAARASHRHGDEDVNAAEQTTQARASWRQRGTLGLSTSLPEMRRGLDALVTGVV